MLYTTVIYAHSAGVEKLNGKYNNNNMRKAFPPFQKPIYLYISILHFN